MLKSVFKIASIALILLLISGGSLYATNFEFNFNEHGVKHAFSGQGGACNPGPLSCFGNDGTRFRQDVLNLDGVAYFHVVIGDPATGFAIESYVTKYELGFWYDYSPDNGGNERSVIGNTTSWRKGNNYDPFGVSVAPALSSKLTGTGTMNPSRAVFRMVLSDSDISLEVFKPQLNRKPKITQDISSGVMSSQFVADMTGLTYDTIGPAAPITNRVSIAEPDMPAAGAGDFDMSFSQRSKVTAGQFKYTPGAGWNSIAGWNSDDSSFDPGTYQYAEDGFDGSSAATSFDVLNVNWASFFDYDQNAAACNTGWRNQAICPGSP